MTAYLDLLRTMSDEVLLEEVRVTFGHLKAANLDADADLLDELARRWSSGVGQLREPEPEPPPYRPRRDWIGYAEQEQKHEGP